MKLRSLTITGFALMATPILLNGCAAVDFLAGGPDGAPGVLDILGDVAVNSGNPPFVVGGLAITTLAGIMKSIANKRNFRETVASVQEGFEALSDSQQVMVKNAISERMPENVKKAVAKIKAKL